MTIRWLSRPLWRWALILVYLAIAGLLMTLNAAYLYLAPKLPEVRQLEEVSYQIPLRIMSADGLLIGEFGDHRRTPLSWPDFPAPFVQAVLAAEDDRFFEHGGVDIRGLLRAFVELVRFREIRSGGSTITMQVARNFFLDKEQKFMRKFNEIVLAIDIERALTKEQIFSLYMNQIFLGHRAYGAEAAAQVYYGKHLNELELHEWAMIAGLPKAPSAYNPIANAERALERRNWILRRMMKLGYIDRDTYAEQRAMPVAVQYHGPNSGLEAAYIAEMARQQVIAQFGQEQAYSGGLRVYTTIDSHRQDAAVQALRSGLHAYDERHGWRGAETSFDVSHLNPLPTQPEADEDAEPHNTQSVHLGWQSLLRTARRVGELEPAVVAEVSDNTAQLVRADGSAITLDWEAMSWARPYINNNVAGEAPSRTKDILKLGDLVRLRATTGEDGETLWRLAQVPAVQGALVALDPTDGSIRALVGGYSFSQSHFNRVVQGQRQAGSAFKPFIYAAGLARGITPATLINDAPIVFDDANLETAWRPTGASNRFYGPTRVREALYRSLNLVSIRLLQQAGLGHTMNTLRQFGLPVERFQRDLSLALGSASVTPLEMANAYSLFANNGYRLEPWFISRIENNAGELLWQAPDIVLCAPRCSSETQPEDTSTLLHANYQPEPPVHVQRSLDPRLAWISDSMMKDVVRRGTGAAANRLGRSDLAGKTGSTNEYFDAWFVGYTPALVSAVWVGFDEPATLGQGEFGGRSALPIWTDFMHHALQDVPVTALPQPPGITTARINLETGRLARPGESNSAFEYFLQEFPPEQSQLPPEYDARNSTILEELF